MTQTHARVLAAITSAILVMTITPGNAAAMAARPTDLGAWIVTLQQGVSPEVQAEGIARAAGGSAGRIFVHALNGFVFHGSAQAANALTRNPGVRTVVADGPIQLAAESLPLGVRRIEARHPTRSDAHDTGFTGAGARIAIMDTGIDLTHPDLVDNLDSSLGINCQTSGPPQDGHGHGTHVAGIAAAVADNDQGVIGVASGARLVPVKVMSDAGTGEWSHLVCGIDHVTGLALDGDPANDVHVVNMSIGDVGTLGSCTDGGVREAICNSVAAGVTYVAAAGNSTTNASTFIPAAFPEVIAVSATVDLDGEKGGLAGCALWIFYCDDTLAEFSNYGAVIDVAAPGYAIYSTWTGGGYQSSSGTSMAAPHAAGVAALVRAAQPDLSPADVRDVLMFTGECQNGEYADTDGSDSCVGDGVRKNDPDGYGEPLVNARRAAGAALGWDARPTVTITSPVDGSAVAGIVEVTADAADDLGVQEVAFSVNGVAAATDVDGSDGWSMTWNTDALAGGWYTVEAAATDTSDRTAVNRVSVSVGSNLQGDWVGTFGADGYVLAGWQGTSDLAALPSGVTHTLEQGVRHSWSASTTDLRALESADESERRAATWAHASQLRARLTFGTAYAGTLHLYAIDWDSTERRQTVTVDDGRGPRSVELTTAFDAGAWIHVDIDVAAGGSVLISVDRTAGGNGVLSGIFLGGTGVPPPPPAPPVMDQPGVQGDWVGTFGADGYVLAGWQGTSDLAALPSGVTHTLEQGVRHSWSASTTDLRALESADESERRAATWAHASQLRARLTFGTAYAGTLHLYAIDWDSTERRQTVTVDDGRGPRSVELTTAFDAGAWIHVDIDVAAGGSVLISVDRTAGGNGVLSGLFLGGVSSPEPEPTVPGAPQNLVAMAGDASVALSWSATIDDGGSAVTGYRIYRGTTPGSGSELATVGTVLSYTDTTAVNGTTYHYSVAALNAVGEGAASAEVEATPAASATVPGAPENLVAMAGDASVALSWSATIDDGGSAVTGYRIYRGTTPGSGSELATVGTVLSYTDTTAVNGTTYHYSVAALNAVGEGAASAEVEATPAASATVPGAPENLVANPHRGKGVDLTWSAPANDGGSTITAYRIYRGTTSGNLVLLVEIGDVSSYRDTATAKKTRYYYVVRAVNSIGEGGASNEATAIAK